MDREYLLKLRNELVNAQIGELLLKYLQDYITSEGCKATVNGDTIKGMCQLVQQIKDIPNQCR